MSLLTPAARVAGVTGLFIGLAIGMPLGAAITPAQADPGDTEDSPSFSCVLDGNQVCGPGNAMGAVPGFYADGVLVSPWPTATVCYAPPTVATMLLGGDGCHPEYVSPALAQLIGWPGNVHRGTGAAPGPVA